MTTLERAHTDYRAYDNMCEAIGIVVDSPGWGKAAYDLFGFNRPPGPNRTPSPRCASGKRQYCACETCY